MTRPIRARYEGRIQGSSMPWVALTPLEASEVVERYGQHIEVILIPTPRGVVETRRLDNDEPV